MSACINADRAYYAKHAEAIRAKRRAKYAAGRPAKLCSVPHCGAEIPKHRKLYCARHGALRSDELRAVFATCTPCELHEGQMQPCAVCETVTALILADVREDVLAREKVSTAAATAARWTPESRMERNAAVLPAGVRSVNKAHRGSSLVERRSAPSNEGPEALGSIPSPGINEGGER